MAPTSPQSRIGHAWYVLALGRQLRKGAPLARRLFDSPLALFRDAAGNPVAMLDRCSHRGTPLSLGRVDEGTVVCPYHGWRYGADGRCIQVPASERTDLPRATRVDTYAACERQGFVWVYSTPNEVPQSQPPELPHLGEPGYHHVLAVNRFDASLLATAENILDVPHTAYVHGGLFRTARRTRTIQVRVEGRANSVEAHFEGEPVPAGVMGRLLAPRGGRLEHVDRFVAPCLAQVEYRLGNTHLLINDLLTPVSSTVTDVFTLVSVRLPGGTATLVRWALNPIARYVARQDKVILRAKTQNDLNFEAEAFVCTEADLLGPHIVRLLRLAERGGEELAAFSTRTALRV